MTRASVQFLIEQCPEWFTATASGASAIEGVARVPGTVWSATGVALQISNFPRPTVGEQVPGTIFPARCPERHIQENRTFCLGLRYLEISDRTIASQWWEQLRQFLWCQSVAEVTGVWPPAHALDHGDAGEFHERALIIARELGIEEEYAAARLNEPSWITSPDLRLLNKRDDPINGRAPCPRGCRAKCMNISWRGRVKIRRKCQKREKLLELVRLERKRRAALAEYWSYVRASGTICCGRMRTCELR